VDGVGEAQARLEWLQEGTSAMKDSSNAPQIFAFALILFVLSIYFVSLQLRRWKYRRIADGLQAEYKSQGLLGTGEITGSSRGRKYTIRTKESRRSTWTTFSMGCVNKGLRLSLHGKFFNPFPNWEFAFAKTERTERAFAIAVNFPNASVPLEERYQGQVQAVFQEVALLDSRLLRKWRNRLEVDQDSISFTMHGVLGNVATAAEVISLLAKLADRVESE
jgi:hypothetical protein